jgi:hypothetical protein
MELPITYEVSGKIEFCDNNGNILNLDATIFAGGYYGTIEPDGNYHLIFSSPKTEDVYLIIRYDDQSGNEQLKTEHLHMDEDIHSLKEDFTFYV